MSCKIITISGKAENGKDYSASLIKSTLELLGFKVLIIHYADYLKYICKQYFGWDGNKDEKGRTILQYVGTEKIRAVKPTYWVDTVRSFLEIFKDDYDYAIIPDTRFPDEVNSWKESGWDITSVKVERIDFQNSLTPEQRLHKSEIALDNFEFDYYIKAKSGYEYLIKEIVGFLDYLMEGK